MLFRSDIKGHKVIKDHRGIKVIKDSNRVLPVLKVIKDIRDHRGIRVIKELLAHLARLLDIVYPALGVETKIRGETHTDSYLILLPMAIPMQTHLHTHTIYKSQTVVKDLKLHVTG